MYLAGTYVDLLPGLLTSKINAHSLHENALNFSVLRA